MERDVDPLLLSEWVLVDSSYMEQTGKEKYKTFHVIYIIKNLNSGFYKGFPEMIFMVE